MRPDDRHEPSSRWAQDLVVAATERRAAWLREAPIIAGKWRWTERRFRGRLQLYWGPALEIYDTVVALAHGLGAAFNEAARPAAHRDADVLFEAMVRLHARAVRACREIGVLLAAGYSTAADANWRTLHELQISAALLVEGGADVARRFLDHEVIDRLKLAKRYEEHHEVLGQEPLEPDTISVLAERKAELVSRYGPVFGKDWGWVAPLFPEKGNAWRPTLHELEERVDLGALSPYQQLANQHLHGGAHTVFTTATVFRGQQWLTAGPTNEGLAEVAQNSLNALGRITTGLLLRTRAEELGDEQMTNAVALLGLIGDACDAFGVGHEAVQAAEARAQQLLGKSSHWGLRWRHVTIEAGAALKAARHRANEVLPYETQVRISKVTANARSRMARGCGRVR